jgi:hypothetical protein
MRFHTPHDGILQVDRVGGLNTYAARMEGGRWTAWGEVRTVVVAASGLEPGDPWVDRVVTYLEDGASLPDVPGAGRPAPQRAVHSGD